MSFLTPLYMLGGLAVALPILFHLIRRQPKGEVIFSSLMFLQPTPPRLTRRSRLENIAILIARALALLFLAAAFSRPFFSQNETAVRESGGTRQVLLIDTSASMQRTGVWQSAVDRSLEFIDALKPTDQIAVVAFDREPRVLLSLNDSSQLTSSQRKDAARAEIKSLAPTWNATDLSAALSFAAELATTSNLEKTHTEAVDQAHLVLVSDMQTGSNPNPLQTYDWPQDLTLQVASVAASSSANASARILNESDDSAEDDQTLRVRVVNSADSIVSQFRLSWETGSHDDPTPKQTTTPKPNNTDSALPFQVPPGQSRIVTVPKPSDAKWTRLVLRGDEQDFDNQQYFAVTPRSIAEVLFLSDSETEKLTADEARESLLYYLDRVPLSDVRREVKIVRQSPRAFGDNEDPRQTPLVFVAGTLVGDVAKSLAEYVENGGQVCVVLDRADYDSPGLRALLQSPDLKITDADVDDYVMFTSIRFRDPLFAAMADPQFNDFTKVRFWNHRHVEGLSESYETIAKFDDDAPAILRKTMGRGSLVVFTFGWQPSESQLALSTKFIPMISALVSPEQRQPVTSYSVGGPIDLAIGDDAKLSLPDGNSVVLKSESDKDKIDRPGLYRYTSDEADVRFAVNLAESESLTDPLETDTLERLGVNIGKPGGENRSAAEKRQLMDVELEGRQRVWQWLLLAAFGAIALETWWSRRAGQNQRVADDQN